MTDAPWLSVIVPVRNGAALLPEALGSIVRDQDDGVEVVVIDDGSTDETPAVLAGFRERVRMRIISRPGGGNWVKASNVGLAEARGRFACFLHHDDRWERGRVPAIREAFGAGGVEFVVHPVWFIDDAGRRLGQWRCPLPRTGTPLPPALVMERLLVQNFIGMPAPVFPRQAALDSGGLDESLWHTADWDLWLRLAARGATRYLPEPLAAFRIRATAQTVTRSHDAQDFRRQLQTVTERYLPTTNLPPRRRCAVQRAGLFSIEMNVVLAMLLHGQTPCWKSLIRAGSRLGPSGLHRYVRDSRIIERVLSRIRLRGGQ
jgi:hypothetical protein